MKIFAQNQNATEEGQTNIEGEGEQGQQAISNIIEHEESEPDGDRSVNDGDRIETDRDRDGSVSDEDEIGTDEDESDTDKDGIGTVEDESDTDGSGTEKKGGSSDAESDDFIDDSDYESDDELQESSDNDDESYDGGAYLKNDPLYIALSQFFISDKSQKNLATILEDISITLKKIAKNKT